MHYKLITLFSLVVVGLGYASETDFIASGAGNDGMSTSTIAPSDVSTTGDAMDSLGSDIGTAGTGKSDGKDTDKSDKSSKGSASTGTTTTTTTTSNPGELTCGQCSTSNLAGCTSWITQPTFEDYRVFNIVCGCANRITPESQCLRFVEDAVNGVEEFAVSKCGVHLRCEALDFDPEPGSHTCDGRCPLGFGCFAQCSTTCAYNVACTVITTV